MSVNRIHQPYLGYDILRFNQLSAHPPPPFCCSCCDRHDGVLFSSTIRSRYITIFAPQSVCLYVRVLRECGCVVCSCVAASAREEFSRVALRCIMCLFALRSVPSTPTRLCDDNYDDKPIRLSAVHRGGKERPWRKQPEHPRTCTKY